jgi:two-component system LytT family sensor kinase
VSPEPPLPTGREIAAALAAVTIVALAQALVQGLGAWFPLRALRPGAVLLVLAEWWWWAAALPLWARLARRFPLAAGLRLRSLAAHAVIALAVSVLAIGMTWALGTLVFGTALRFAFFQVWLNRLDLHLVLYAAIVAALSARDAAWVAAREEARSAALDEQLSRAQLEVLGLQLHPHFLFNTLNAVAELAHEDRPEAVRAVRDLRALLALSFDRAATPDVALLDEIAFVRAYADIQRRRFRGLQFRIDVAPEVLGARVPHLLLQPLVENALRHGVASAGGDVCLRAFQAGSELHIEVTDDGSGRPATRVGSEGVGLRATRDRLAQLAGGPHRLELVPRAAGGMCARISLPLQVPA